MTSLPTTRPLSDAHVADAPSCLDAFQYELDYLCRALRRLGVPSADIEDLAQEVFLVVARRRLDYDPARPLRPYLFGIALRVAKAHARRRARERPEPSLELPDPAAWPDQTLDDQRARDLVLRALERVPLARRAVFILHDIDGIGMRDAARALSIPMFTGYSRLRKARKEFEAAVRSLQRERKAP